MVDLSLCADCGSGRGRLTDVSLRLLLPVQVAVDDRLKLLQEAHRDFGPASQHFLSSEYPQGVCSQLRTEQKAGGLNKHHVTHRSSTHPTLQFYL